jgi:ATP-dependent Clp protease adaptor protein ClpS
VLVLQNDSFTPKEFVVQALQQHLGLERESAVKIMLKVHHEGRAVAGQFSANEAVHLAERLQAAAREAGHPLRCTIETR